MSVILAIDPGSQRSGLVVFDSELDRVDCHAKMPNEWVLERLINNDSGFTIGVDLVVIEAMSPRGMPTSLQEMEAIHWAGRFHQAAILRFDGGQHPLRVERLGRDRVKLHFLGAARPKGAPKADTRIRAVLIDRFGGVGGKDAAIGLKATPGPLYGIAADEWAALALAIAWAEGAR